MSEILPTITIEIGNLDKDVYPLRLLSADNLPLAKEEFIASAEFDRSKWKNDPIESMLSVEEGDIFEEIGTKLYSLIHQGDVGKKWDEFIDKYPNCRTQMLIKPSEIFTFPWELICKDDIERPAADASQTFLRAYQTGICCDMPKESSLLPLRVLIVIGASQDDKRVLAKDELKEIETKIRNNNREDSKNRLVHRLIDIERLWNPTITRLLEKYEEFEPHIFHFIGHGAVDKGKARLIIDSETGIDAQGKPSYDRIEWQYDSIYADFKGKWMPRLVLINSCRTETKGEKPSEDVQKHIWSIGNVFRKLGVPAIIAMQADISGWGAGIFSGTLYKQLAEFDTIDMALGHARNALKTHGGGFENREWAIPILTVSTLPEKILPFNFKVDDDKLREIRGCPDLTEVRFFSNRINERRKLLQSLYPPTNKNLKDLIIVRGKKEAGKSWITKFCLEALALLDLDVRYVPVSGETTIDWLDFILQIRDGDTSLPGSLIRKALSEKAFYPFNWELINRTNLKEPPAWDGNPIQATKANLGEKSNWTQDFIEKTFVSFRKSLLKSAELNKPLIIVFDDFPKGDNGFFQQQMTEWIVPNLIRPAATGLLREENENGEIRSVKFVLVLQDSDNEFAKLENEFEKFNLASLAGKYNEFPLNYMSSRELKTCLTEYIKYIKPGLADEIIESFIQSNFAVEDIELNDFRTIPPSKIKYLLRK